MAETVQQLLRERTGQSSPAVKFGDRVWTWQEHLQEARRQASALITIADAARPLHVGTLLGNTPAMLTAMAAAGLGAMCCAGSTTPAAVRPWAATSPRPIARSC